MIVTRAKAEIMDVPDGEAGIKLLRKIEWAARISHRSEEDQKADSWERFLRAVVLQHGDWSVVEHAAVTVDATMDRGITHEWVRHRLNAFTQESTRFVSYVKKMPPKFIYPIPGVYCPRCEKEFDIPYLYFDDDNIRRLHHVRLGEPSEILEKQEACPYDPEWYRIIQETGEAYRELLAKGWKPQEARSVFPNALASRIVTTTNLRNWRHILLMRTSKETHPQMREITIPLLAEFQQKIPILFEDITPGERQADAMRRMR